MIIEEDEEEPKVNRRQNQIKENLLLKQIDKN